MYDICANLVVTVWNSYVLKWLTRLTSEIIINKPKDWFPPQYFSGFYAPVMAESTFGIYDAQKAGQIFNSVLPNP
ncbi:hypothetical protein OUZ56_011594 [Daphnia magna]|uniref:Uncharacterized protein n=1 Tax=Daphnia magna TaxID=35525 RepID=A0ABQ9Z0K0_9CRUS|nr:hypothetical protein OUZ56_011594 [Daphnia magna]